MIDLSYLTEEEQGVIMTVLKRDAELKKAEEERIKHLQPALVEEGQRKYLTGEWFYQAKSQRHQDRIHGSEIIWASIQRRPDFTRSLDRSRRASGSAADDVIRSPLLERKDRNGGSLTSESRQDPLRMSMRSPKLRHNPFNSMQVDIESERPYPQLHNGAQGSCKDCTLESTSSLVEQESQPSSARLTLEPGVLAAGAAGTARVEAEEPKPPAAKRPAPVPRKRTKPPRGPSSHTQTNADSNGGQRSAVVSPTSDSWSGVVSPTTSLTSVTSGLLKETSSCSSIESHLRNEPMESQTRRQPIESQPRRGPIESYLRSEPMRGEEVLEGGAVEVRTAVERRAKEEENKEEKRKEDEEEKRLFTPVARVEGRDRMWKPEDIVQQHRPTMKPNGNAQRETRSRSNDGDKRVTSSRSNEGEQRVTSSRSNEGEQRESSTEQRAISIRQPREIYSMPNEGVQRVATSRLDKGQEREIISRSDRGQERETPPLTDWPRRDAGQHLDTLPSPPDSGRRLEASPVLHQDEWTPGTRTADGKVLKDPRGARAAWSPSPERMSRERETLQDSPQRWTDSTTLQTPQTMEPDIRIPVLVADTAALKAPKDTIHDSKRPNPSSVLNVTAKPADTDRAKSPQKVSAAHASKHSEEGDSIAKVLEWFNRSTDSSNRQDTDLDDTKDDITDSEEEAKMTMSKTSGNVYTIVPRQEMPKEKKKLFPDDACWGEEGSLDLSDEQSDPQVDTPNIMVRPFQPGLSRNSPYQPDSPHALEKSDTGHQQQQYYYSQSRRQTETSSQLQHIDKSRHQEEVTYQPQHSDQFRLQTEASYQPQRSSQLPIQTEAGYQPQRSSQSSFQKETSYHPQYSIQSHDRKEMSYQSHRFQSPTKTEPKAETDPSKISHEANYPIHLSGKTEAGHQSHHPATPKHNKEMPVKTHPPVHAVVRTETVLRAQQQRPEAQRHNPARLEDGGASRGHGPARQEDGGGSRGQDTGNEGTSRQSQRSSHSQQGSLGSDQDERPKIANLKSFWEKGNSGPKILISRTNVNTENKRQTPDKQMDIGPGPFVSEQIEEPQKSVQNFEIRTMSPSLKPSSEKRPQRKQVIESHEERPQRKQVVEIHEENPKRKQVIEIHEDRPHSTQVIEIEAQQENVVDDMPIKQKYTSVDTFDKSTASASSTERMDSLEMRSHLNKDVTSSEVKESPMSSSNSRFAKKVTEEATKHPYTPVQTHPARDPPLYTYTAHNTPGCTSTAHDMLIQTHTACETPVSSKHPDQASKAEVRDKDMTPESGSQSRVSLQVLPTSPVLSAKQQDSQHFENRRERLRQLKSFWENELKGSKVTTSKPRESSVTSSSNLTKRFTKSAFDLRSTGLASDDDEDVADDHNYSGFAMKGKPDKPCLADTNFKSLKDFWAGSLSAQGRPKSPTSNTSRIQSPAAVKPHECPSSPSTKSRAREGETGGRRSSVDSRTGKTRMSGPGLDQRRERAAPQTRRNSEQVSISSALRNQNRSNQNRRTSTGNLNERAAAMRRASSMHSLAYREDEEDSCSPKPGRRNQDPLSTAAAKPKKTQEFGLSFGKKTVEKEAGKSREKANERRPSRTMDDSPLARSFIPRDYQHYLGIPERTGTCPAAPPPAPPQQEAREQLCTSFSAEPECEWSRGGGPARSSTPVGAEEAGGRRGSLGPRPYSARTNEELSQGSPRLRSAYQPQRANEEFSPESPKLHPSYGTRTNEELPQGSPRLRPAYQSQRANEESPRSSTSGSWTSSRKNSKCDEDEGEGPVQRALRRAAYRPAYTKSLEDITMEIGPERDNDHTHIFMHSSGDASPPPSTLSSFSDVERMRKMSKSVPSFLQEDTHSAQLSSVSGSAMSVCSGEFGGVEVQGSIQFTLNYVHKLKEFHIFVVQCKNLATADHKRNRSDPYVKSYLMPDKTGLGKRKTSVKKKTVNPLFNEILRYRVRMDYLKSQVLNLSAWHHDTFGKNSFLGEVELDLSVWDFANTHMNYMSLKARTTSTAQPAEYRGEMKLAVRYLPQMTYTKTSSGSGEVHIWVKECKNLPLIRGATIDPYVKCFVLPDTSRKSRQKTRVLKRTDCPVFNHTMVYDGFQREDLKEACVELTDWDRDRLANHLLGGIRLGLGTGHSYGALVEWMDSTGQEVALWERMMEAPTEWVEDVLPLRLLITHTHK
ncbi:uncharacterized protein LOC134455821 isoform X2 [Engraulis encrasicolus]|uniref:uncharacterized protein LOC134455821 isoform X2 n=1 Tax=Engraulis encrasicolus TaxID=184585 RepID=UPI002FD52EA5